MLLEATLSVVVIEVLLEARQAISRRGITGNFGVLLEVEGSSLLELEVGVLLEGPELDRQG